MKPEALIKNLKNYGVDVSIGLTCKASGKPSTEADELLNVLNEHKQDVIDYLISQTFVPLSVDVALPSEWIMTEAMKKYTYNTPTEVLEAIESGHDPLFLLLWCLKALCFVDLRKELYQQIEIAMQTHYRYSHEDYTKKIESEVNENV